MNLVKKLNKILMSQMVAISLHHFDGIADKFYALKSMGLLPFRVMKNGNFDFFRLMGTGSGGGFGIMPEFSRYVTIAVWRDEGLARKFYYSNPEWKDYVDKTTQTQIVFLKCCAVHGFWYGHQPFTVNSDYDLDKPLAVITRATVKWLDMIRFWRDVPSVTNRLKGELKPLYAVGIGEWPLRFQATFSIWENGRQMEKFAYRDNAHSNMVRKTRKINWYKEELFARFHIDHIEGDKIIDFDFKF